MCGTLFDRNINIRTRLWLCQHDLEHRGSHDYGEPADPARESNHAEGTLIYAAYIGNPQGTVKVLAFYVALEGLPSADAWIALARRISTSVVLGKHPLDAEAGAHRLGGLVVTTPDGWAASMQLGSESVSVIVQQLRKVPLGKDGPSCSVQWGGTFDQIPDGAVALADTLLGQSVTWNEWNDRDGAHTRTTLQRAMYNSDVAVTCHAASRDELVALRKIFGTLRVSGT